MAQSQESRELEKLRMQNAQLMEEVDKYRTATEDALQQLDWCIGYFVGCNKPALARALGSNRGYIRAQIRKKDEELPENPEEHVDREG
jgi:hypothetical protein